MGWDEILKVWDGMGWVTNLSGMGMGWDGKFESLGWDEILKVWDGMG